MKKYEYLIRTDIDTFDFPEKELNKLGEEGWELVGFERRGDFSGHITTYIFKREIANLK